MNEQPRPTTSDTSPYRAAYHGTAPTPPRRRRYALGIAAIATAAALALAVRAGRHRPVALDAPPELRDAVRRIPAPGSDLPPAVPLEPLLAADAPEGIALLEPSGEATRLGRGDALRLRFNRPMVSGARVGRTVENPPLRFAPTLRGEARWTSRSTLTFEPDPEAWSHTHEVRLALDPALASLAGEALGDAGERTVVLDATPRLLTDASPRRVTAGEPLRLAFDGPVDTRSLGAELMAYEIGGGGRALSLALGPGRRDADGRAWVDVRLSRALEPGAQVALVAAPMLLGAEGESPERMDFEFQPRPMFEGIDCPADAASASSCTYQGPPGRVVDIAQELRLRASVPLDPASLRLRVSPVLPNLATTVSGAVLTVRGDWEAGQVYELRVDEARASGGGALARFSPLAVRSAGLAPTVQFASGRVAFERDDTAALRLTAVNVARGGVRYLAVRPGEEFAAALAPEAFASSAAQRASTLALAELVPDARPNRWARGALRWLDPAAGRASEMAVMEFRAAPESAAGTTFAQRTDLGLTARALDRGVLAWVTSLATGQPVAGAEVALAQSAGGALASARTDADGVAWLDLASPARDPDQPLAVRATAGGDRAIIVLDPRTAVRPGNFGLAPGESAGAADAPVATVFTDRGVYRAGDRVHVAVVARTPTGGGVLRALRNRALTVRLIPESDPVAISTARLSLTAFGTAAADVALPASAPVGTYTLEVVVDGANANAVAGRAALRVAEYREPAMRVDLLSDAREPADGDALAATVAARYLFGAPAAGASVRWTLSREPGGEYPARWDGFTFAPDGATSHAGTVDSGEGDLDERGSLALRTTVRQSALQRERETLEVEVTDASGQATSARRAMTTYPAGYEAGLRRGPAWVPAGTTLDAESVVIAHDGTPAVGRALTARIAREGWESYWEWAAHAHDDGAGEQGGYRARRARQSTEVHRCELISGDSPVHCAFAPSGPGVYLLEVQTRDDAGRTSVASRRVYVAGPGDRPDRDPPGTALSLTPERAALSVGEHARLAFESPFPDAEALITVERDGVVHRERRRVGPGGNVVEFETTGAMVPNAFVSLVLVRPRTGRPENGVDPGAPDLRLGEAEITVRPQSEPFAVTLTVPAGAARPDQDVTVEAEVRDAQGHPARADVTLFAVDEGTLRLTNYTTPDATAGLYPRRAPSFAVEDLRRALASREEPTTALPGGDGGESAPARLREEREHFDPTPLWRPHLRTDAHGRVRATFHLPNRSTQYRVMAVAVDEGARAGRSAETLVARRDVVLRPALPRFAVEGDRFEAAVFVHNASERAVDAVVVPEVAGERRASRAVHLEPGAEVRVGEWVDARGVSSVLRFAVQGEGGDVVTATVPVLARAHTERGLSAGAVTGDAELTVALPEGTAARDGEVALDVSNRPFVGDRAALESLDAAPYADVVTTAAVLASAAAQAEITPAVRERAQRAGVRLADLQAVDGSFGHWSSSEAGDAHAASLAALALHAASVRGLPVPAEVLQRAQTWLTRAFETGVLAGVDAASREDQALALHALAAAGHPDAARAAELFDRRESLSAYATAHLGLALDRHDLRRTALAQRAGRALTRREAPDADETAIAPALELVAQTEGAHEFARPLASRLLSLRRPGDSRWSDAESTAAALAALGAYAEHFVAQGPLQARVTLDGQVLAPRDGAAGSARYVLPFERVMRGEHRVRVHVDGTGFYALSGRWGVALGPADQVARGRRVALHRVLETAAGAPLAEGAHVHLGDLVRVRLFVYAEQEPPPDVVLRDRAGAGFEPVDQGLDTTPQGALAALLGAGVDDEEAIDPRGYYAQRSLGLISYRAFGTSDTVFCLERADAGLREFTYGVRATTPGTFVLLPAELAAEHDADFVARSTAVTLTVDP